jgi:hypothetical protein
MIIRIFLIAGVLGFAVIMFRGSGGAGQLALRRLVAVGLAVLGVISVLMPQAVTWLANRVGVGRGTDLVLYILVVGFLWVTIGTHRRIGDLERRYAKLARRQAIHEAMEHSREPTGDAGSVAYQSDR